MTIFPMARIALRNLFTKPATRRYPYVTRPAFAASRGRIAIDFDTCVLCGNCARHCPANAITVERAGGLWKIDRFACVNCGACVEACPKNSLAMENERSKAALASDIAAREEAHMKPPAAPAATAAPAGAAKEPGDA